ncbi:MAG: inositol monophosphatase family protein [Candidatus Woesebacteria bacterium]|nr:inositol monophosphatase family protein [Candidatus Woesebacteria bacterium]
MKEMLQSEYLNLPREELDRVVEKAKIELEDFFDKATRIFIDNHGKEDLVVKYKSQNDFATPADTEIESLFQDWVKNHFANHNVYGEEYGDKTDKKSNWMWAIDPIDGTTNYKAGNDECAIAVSLRYKDFPILGMVRFPIKNESFMAKMFSGTKLNGNIAVPSKETNLKISVVSTSYLNHPERFFAMTRRFWDNIGGVHMEMCSLSEACYVVSGKLQAALLYELGPHEWPAVFLLAREAGCVMEPMAKPGLEFSIEGMGNRSFVIAANNEIMKSLNSLIDLPSKLS